ncbi:hypothetical protein CW745_01400 [Psychromonas sp. psych-6C06]|uniref:putative signal transducing protein n=1 Tax=Psychromonas sp. psych-6C06 TaxID=2058089 RepID=UPI000C34D0A6|nr:DUF2007 domain-containing protein [Psychromonas sp. psych-6C06]PKF63535.1 hypothetical protein CW745_01400 [Psychromonas sp. psych-6C06]
MKMVFSNENRFISNNVKNLIEAQGIATFIKNEFSQGAIGEVSMTDAWPEVWIFDDEDFNQAIEIVECSQTAHAGEEWLCNHCEEANDPSFEICWHCQNDRQ